MGIEEKQLRLVQLALSGHKESLNQLAEIIQAPLRSYVLRIIYQEELTDDIVQETLLEMYNIFTQLKRADLFWPWLCKIALNKVRRHSNEQKRHRELLKIHAEQTPSGPGSMDGLAAVINQEFQEAIAKALSFLSDRQRAVLSMRCYENMPYSQIAEIMDLSELGCRLLFVRARKKLQHKLSSFGYGQKSLLLTALALVGKLTAPSEAAAAQICLSPSILSVGGLAAGIAFVTSKTVLMTLTASGAIVAGTVALKQDLFRTDAQNMVTTKYSVTETDISPSEKPHFNEGYFFFPQGKQGPVLTRFTVHQDQGTTQVLQNDSGNYTYDARQQTATIHNYHYWKSDLSVMTLPTDSPDLESFLAGLENRSPAPRPIKSDSSNLFVMISGDERQQTRSFGAKNYDAMMEERFQYNWPAHSGLIDNRDPLHQQGWCRVKIEGHFYEKTLSGIGELPFVYSKVVERPAWLKLAIKGEQAFIDTPGGAAVLNAVGQPVLRYPYGTFLCGLNRPWSGLHAIDTVRRDAAQFRIPFETGLEASGKKAVVSLRVPGGQIEYIIDMEKDLIEKISFIDLDKRPVGEFQFNYLEFDDISGTNFTMVRLSSGVGSTKTEQFHWLSELMAERFLSE